MENCKFYNFVLDESQWRSPKLAGTRRLTARENPQSLQLTATTISQLQPILSQTNVRQGPKGRSKTDSVGKRNRWDFRTKAAFLQSFCFEVGTFDRMLYEENRFATSMISSVMSSYSFSGVVVTKKRRRMRTRLKAWTTLRRQWLRLWGKVRKKKERRSRRRSSDIPKWPKLIRKTRRNSRRCRNNSRFGH